MMQALSTRDFLSDDMSSLIVEFIHSGQWLPPDLRRTESVLDSKPDDRLYCVDTEDRPEDSSKTRRKSHSVLKYAAVIVRTHGNNIGAYWTATKNVDFRTDFLDCFGTRRSGIVAGCFRYHQVSVFKQTRSYLHDL